MYINFAIPIAHFTLQNEWHLRDMLYIHTSKIMPWLLSCPSNAMNMSWDHFLFVTTLFFPMLIALRKNLRVAFP